MKVKPHIFEDSLEQTYNECVEKGENLTRHAINEVVRENIKENLPSQNLWEEDWWIKEFKDFYWEQGKYQGRTLGIDGYIDFIKKLLTQSKLQHNQDCTREEWARGDERAKITKEIEKYITLALQKEANTPLGDRKNGWDKLLEVRKELRDIITNQ